MNGTSLQKIAATSTDLSLYAIMKLKRFSVMQVMRFFAVYGKLITIKIQYNAHEILN
jgi:hypothetical protein